MENDTNVLPATYNGTFPFTNYTNKEFIGKWDGVEYKFPAAKTSPLVIPSASPLETQEIRKKFARDLATQVFYESDRFAAMNIPSTQVQLGHIPALYTEADLAPYIQRCLEPLEAAQAIIGEKEEKQVNLRTDGKGKKVSRVLDGEESLIGNDAVIA